MLHAQFANKTILITGASSGIGLASARAFIAQGAQKVYLAARSLARLHEICRELGPAAQPLALDVSQPAHIQQVATALQAQGEQLDIVFANAGIAHHNQFGNTTESDYQQIFSTNVAGVFFTVQALLPLLRDHASVVLNSSVANCKGMPNLSLYNASKAAVRSFARSWANDLRQRKIRVNAISPGVTQTPILQQGLGFSEQEVNGLQAYMQQITPAERMADVDEIAAAVLFLASDAASYINGADLQVDGGLAQI